MVCLSPLPHYEGRDRTGSPSLVIFSSFGFFPKEERVNLENRANLPTGRCGLSGVLRFGAGDVSLRKVGNEAW